MVQIIRSSSDKAAGERKRRIWRITESAPAGEFVDSDQIQVQRPPPLEPSQPGWAMSSFELLNGVDVSDDPETVPADLFDEYFKRT